MEAHRDGSNSVASPVGCQTLFPEEAHPWVVWEGEEEGLYAGPVEVSAEEGGDAANAQDSGSEEEEVDRGCIEGVDCP